MNEPSPLTSKGEVVGHGGTNARVATLASIRAAEPGTVQMFIAMNRFKVIKGEEKSFEHVWLSRETHLQDVPGFMEFHLLRGPERDDHTLYSSHTVWSNAETFAAWTRSEQFRQAHGGTGQHKPLYVGHPEFEGFEVIQTVARAPQRVTDV